MKAQLIRGICFSLILLSCIFVAFVPVIEEHGVALESNSLSTEPMPMAYVNRSDKWAFGGFRVNNSDFCDSGDEIEVLIVVHSSVTHFHSREVLRRFFPPDYKAIFLVGQLTDPGLREAISQEVAAKKDLVVGDFYDSYRNLTLKHVMGMTWVAKYCSKAQLVLKIDDDIFVNFPLLRQLIAAKFPKSKSDPLITRTGRKLIGCFIQRDLKVIRNSSSKWYLPEKEYPDAVFPEFCSGWSYITTVEVINALLGQVTNNVPLLWIDDVYVTGILRRGVGDIGLERLNKWFNTEIGPLYEWISSGHQLKWRYIFSNANGDVALLQEAFEANQRCGLSGCRCCFPLGRDALPSLQEPWLRSGFRPKAAVGSVERITL